MHAFLGLEAPRHMGQAWLFVLASQPGKPLFHLLATPAFWTAASHYTAVLGEHSLGTNTQAPRPSSTHKAMRRWGPKQLVALLPVYGARAGRFAG